jgi:hypothetical protein
MPGVVIETANSLDGKTYQASIVPKQETIEYWLAPALSPGGKQPQTAHITLTATATGRKSIFGGKNPPVLVVCYGIGRMEFDAFCALLLEILSSCDMPALPSAPNRMAIDEICARHGLTADQGEWHGPGLRRPVPFLMLFDHDAAARGY